MKTKKTANPELKPYDLSASKNHVSKEEFQNPHYRNAYDLSISNSHKQKCTEEHYSKYKMDLP